MPHWVFVWTVGDVVAAVVIVGALLVFGVLFAILGIDKLWHRLTGSNRRKAP